MDRRFTRRAVLIGGGASAAGLVHAAPAGAHSAEPPLPGWPGLSVELAITAFNTRRDLYLCSNLSIDVTDGFTNVQLAVPPPWCPDPPFPLESRDPAVSAFCEAVVQRFLDSTYPERGSDVPRYRSSSEGWLWITCPACGCITERRGACTSCGFAGGRR